MRILNRYNKETLTFLTRIIQCIPRQEKKTVPCEGIFLACDPTVDEIIWSQKGIIRLISLICLFSCCFHHPWNLHSLYFCFLPAFSWTCLWTSPEHEAHQNQKLTTRNTCTQQGAVLSLWTEWLSCISLMSCIPGVQYEKTDGFVSGRILKLWLAAKAVHGLVPLDTWLLQACVWYVSLKNKDTGQAVSRVARASGTAN